MYLCWFDDNPKKPQDAKITEACAAYRAKFGTEPTEVLVSEGETVEGLAIPVRPVPYIRKSTIWVGVVE